MMELFRDHPTLRAVIDAALERRVGSLQRAPDDDPVVSRIDLGCYAIFDGDSSHPSARRWLEELEPPIEILLPPSRGWRDLADRALGDRLSDRPMRAFSPHELDRSHLRRLAETLPDGFRIEPVTLESAHLLEAELRPHALQSFADAERFVARGFGFLVRSPQGAAAAQSSSYAISSRRVEVAVGARERFRRRGLGRAVAARMVLECLDRGLRPEWSASNPVSKRLARSLGYRPDALCDILYYE